MWWNEGLQCAVETGFNYSNQCENILEQQQKTAQDLCTITITSSDSSCKNSPFSAAILGITWVFLTSGVLLSFFFLIFTIHFRKNRIVKMSSPNLNIVTLLGSGLTYSSAYLFGVERNNSLTRPSLEMLVQVRISLLCIGVSLAFGPILGKSWRLYKVFSRQVPDKRVIIKDFQLLVLVSVLVLADIILLLIWMFVDPVQCLQSLHADLKCSCFVSPQGILLIYGAYLAGLTDNLSCSPVNQSLTLIIGIAIIFLSTGAMLVVNRFFHLWHNLVFGFTSGGIFVCTSTINCLIFIPQVRKWKAFEKQKDDVNNMAKYFSSSSKNFHSTMYSDEEIYQLLGEKDSMMKQLVEKDTAIATLQEQVNNAKKKLMRLVTAEEKYNAIDSPFPSSYSAASCSYAAVENPMSSPFSPGQGLNSRQLSPFTVQTRITSAKGRMACPLFILADPGISVIIRIFLTHTVLGPVPSQCFYPDSDSGSSSSGRVTHCDRRQRCEVCHDCLSSSSDSCITDTDHELSVALDYCAKLYGKRQPVVNFIEDLEPTYV
uniref:G protein-coupled receptor 156 n=1 Tax=Podarcis muralis TaxID=64176 RepID=A0A670JQI0_PODMU